MRESGSGLANMLENNTNNARQSEHKKQDWVKDLHTSQDDNQFGYLLSKDEENKAAANQSHDQLAFNPVPNSPTDSEDESGSDSDAGPQRW